MESNINDSSANNNNQRQSEKQGKPKSKKDKNQLQTAEPSGGGTQPTGMQLKLENDKPRIRSSQGSASQNFNSSSGRPPMSKRGGDSVSQSSKKDGSAAKDRSGANNNRRSSKTNQGSKDNAGGQLKGSDSVTASKKVFSSNQLLDAPQIGQQNDQQESRSNIGGQNQKLHKQQSSSLNNLNSKTIAGDMSQTVATTNVVGQKSNTKKTKNSATRAKENISKLSEKKGSRKDTTVTKKQSKEGVDQAALSPPDAKNLALDMQPNKQRSSSAKNTKRSTSPQSQRSVNRFDSEKNMSNGQQSSKRRQSEQMEIQGDSDTSPIRDAEDNQGEVSQRQSANGESNKDFDDLLEPGETKAPDQIQPTQSAQKRNEEPPAERVTSPSYLHECLADVEDAAEEENLDSPDVQDVEDEEELDVVETPVYNKNVNIAEKFRIAMKQTVLDHPLMNKMNPQMLMPPPEELIKKSAQDDEPVKTGAPIAFLKFQRLYGRERIEKMNPDNLNKGLVPSAPDGGGGQSDIPAANTINDYMINAKEANRLVYCRFGEKYITDLEKRKNSSLLSSNQPTTNLSSASYLINIKKLIDEHNIDGERRDFRTMKTGQMGKTLQPTPQQYYKPTSPEDKTLIFESRFESGNLLTAIKISDSEYDLVLQNDINTNGHTQWYFFRISNTIAGQRIKLNMLNLAKPDSLYNYGMKILCFSNKIKQQEGTGWHRVGESINYYANHYKRENNRFCRTYYTFTFSHTFEHDDDQQFFAHCFPFTYSDLQEDLSRIEKIEGISNYYHRGTLTRTLAGNKCEFLSITSKDKDPKSMKALAKKGVFISARVHPGESNASWMMKGVIEFLVSNTPEARALRDHFIFKIVPILNPDGVINGNYRCSLSGQDLNRRWKVPNKVLHPVNFAVKKMMRSFSKEREIVLYCDLHGHSRRKNIFMYGNNIKEHPHSTRVFPYIMSKLCDYFSFEQSRFSMSRTKDGTARIAMYKELNISNIFTMEASFCGADKGQYKDQHFTTEYLMVAGRRLLETLIVYCKIDVQKTIREQNLKGRKDAGDDEEPQEKPAYQDINASALEKELTQNKKLINMTMGEGGGSSGSDSEPSADNLEEEDMAKIAPIKRMIQPVKKIEKKPMPKKTVTLLRKPQSPNTTKRQAPPVVKELSRSPVKKGFGQYPFNNVSIRMTKNKPIMKDAWTQTTPKSKEQQEKEKREHRERKRQQQFLQQQQQQQYQMQMYQKQINITQHRGSNQQFNPNMLTEADQNQKAALAAQGTLNNLASRYQNQMDKRNLNNTQAPVSQNPHQAPHQLFNSPQDPAKSLINPQMNNSFNSNPMYMNQAQNQSNQKLETKKNVSESGHNPQPQIRIRTDPYKQKPSNDLAKFEEKLLLTKDPSPQPGRSCSDPLGMSYGPQHGSATQSVHHRGSNKRLPQIQSSGSQRQKLSTQNSNIDSEYQTMNRLKNLNQTHGSNNSALLQNQMQIPVYNTHQRQVSNTHSSSQNQQLNQQSFMQQMSMQSANPQSNGRHQGKTQYNQGFNSSMLGQKPQNNLSFVGRNPQLSSGTNQNSSTNANPVFRGEQPQMQNMNRNIPYTDQNDPQQQPGVPPQAQQPHALSPNKLKRLPLNAIQGTGSRSGPQGLPVSGTASAQGQLSNPQGYASAMSYMNNQMQQPQGQTIPASHNVTGGQSPITTFYQQNKNLQQQSMHGPQGNQQWSNSTIQQHLNESNKNAQNMQKGQQQNYQFK